VDTTQIASGATETVLDGQHPKIYVAEVPGGGYIKVVAIGTNKYWEYTSTINFK
jgi:hypothetical protein